MSHHIPWFELTAWAASVLAIPAMRHRPSLLVFPVLLGLIAGVETHQTFFQSSDTQSNVLVYNLFEPIMWAGYATSIYLSYTTTRYRKLLLLLAGVYAVVMAISIPYYLSIAKTNVIGIAVGAVFLIGLILLKFYEMLRSPHSYNFLKLPYFYILFAFLLFNVGTLPYFTMGNWLYYDMNQLGAANMLRNVMSVLNYILYTTYTVCFIWIRVTKASY